MSIVSQRPESQLNAESNYNKTKRFIKPVSFNREKDADLIAIVDQMDDFSGWVKEQLKNLKSPN